MGYAFYNSIPPMEIVFLLLPGDAVDIMKYIFWGGPLFSINNANVCWFLHVFTITLHRITHLHPQPTNVVTCGPWMDPR